MASDREVLIESDAIPESSATLTLGLLQGCPLELGRNPDWHREV
jgi:hypothetical protein